MDWHGWIEEMKALVDGREYLKALVELKKQKPDLKILLSVGGWDSDGFCYMAKTQEGRAEFIESCIDLIKSYGLDGIDLDWEYPTNGGWNEIASCSDCVRDARQLMKEFRRRLNEEGESQAGMDLVRMGMEMNLDMAGDTPENRKKFNLGVPFYNEGDPYLVPYYREWDGYVDASPDDPEIKVLQRSLYEALNGQK